MEYQEYKTEYENLLLDYVAEPFVQKGYIIFSPSNREVLDKIIALEEQYPLYAEQYEKEIEKERKHY